MVRLAAAMWFTTMWQQCGLQQLTSGERSCLGVSPCLALPPGLELALALLALLALRLQMFTQARVTETASGNANQDQLTQFDKYENHN